MSGNRFCCALMSDKPAAKKRRAKALNVKELIELLGEYPGEMRVVVDGYEDGYDDVNRNYVEPVKVKLHTGKHRWEGRHQELGIKEADDSDAVEVLAIRRTSH